MTPNTFLTLSLTIGLILVLRGFWLNRQLTGATWAMPWNYPLAAKLVYFGGLAVVIVGNLVVRIFFSEQHTGRTAPQKVARVVQIFKERAWYVAGSIIAIGK